MITCYIQSHTHRRLGNGMQYMSFDLHHSTICVKGAIVGVDAGATDFRSIYVIMTSLTGIVYFSALKIHICPNTLQLFILPKREKKEQNTSYTLHSSICPPSKLDIQFFLLFSIFLPPLQFQPKL